MVATFTPTLEGSILDVMFLGFRETVVGIYSFSVCNMGFHNRYISLSQSWKSQTMFTKFFAGPARAIDVVTPPHMMNGGNGGMGVPQEAFNPPFWMTASGMQEVSQISQLVILVS